MCIVCSTEARYARRGSFEGAGQAFRTLAVCAAAILSISFCVKPAAAADPSLSGFLTINFAFHPDDPDTPGDQSFWSYAGHNESLVLTLPSVLDISAIPGPGTLSWADSANWSTFPLNTSGFTVSQNGNGGFTTTANNGQANLDVLGGFGPSESTTITNVAVTNITPSGAGPCPTCTFAVYSNSANTKYNVTLPAGVDMTVDQFAVKVQNLTVNSGANMESSPPIIRQNLTNHGSGNFGGEIQGNLINDALVASGDVANAVTLTLDGQFQNTGEFHNTAGVFTLQSATGNAGTLEINGGELRPQAAFANSGTMKLSSGYLGGPGTVTNSGTFQWTGGWIDNATNFVGSVVNTSNAFTISGAASKLMFGPLTNSDTITQSGGSEIDIGGQTTLTNQSAAIYNITDDSKIGSGFQGGNVSNAGTFKKSGGTGTSDVDAAFANTGTIQVDTGTLRFTGGGTLNGGSFSVAGGATAEIQGGGNFSVIGANTASGGGTLKISGGHVFVAGGNSGSFTNFTGGTNLVVTSNGILEAKSGGTLTLNLTGSSSVQLTGGSIGEAGSTLNNGNFQWSGGDIRGNVTNTSANFTITTSSHTLVTGTLANSGSMTVSGGGVNIAGGGTLANQAGGLLDILDDSDIDAGFQGGFLTNAGTFRKSGGSGTTLIGIPFSNTGTIVINSGTLQASGGSFTLSSSSTLEFKLAGTTVGQDFGKLFAAPNLAASGTLKVTLAPGFNPVSGNSFDILDWSNTVSGFFSTLTLPALSAGLAWNPNELYTTGVLSVIADIPGDYNHSGGFDAGDYVVWRKDPNRTQAGYDLWRSHYGGAPGSGSGFASGQSSAVPEPDAALLGLMVLAAAALQCSRQRRLRPDQES
jgi:hypothetical protein